MELTEQISSINKQLSELFGIDTITSLPIWRIVWSEDQLEKRLMKENDRGMPLLIYEVRLVPKYRQWIQNKYILERLVLVPDENVEELAGAQISYECLWVFEDNKGNYLPPKFQACQFIINTVLVAQFGTHNLKKYNDPEATKEMALEEQRKRVDSIVEELFGEQSGLGGSTVTGETIIVPGNYNKRIN